MQRYPREHSWKVDEEDLLLNLVELLENTCLFLNTTAEHPEPVVTCTTPPGGVMLNSVHPGGIFSLTVLLPNLTPSKRALPVSSLTAV